mgnify:FL=1
MNTKIQKIKEYIEGKELKKPNRAREIVYTRAIICNMLKEEGLNLTETGKMFGRKHDWAIYMRKHYNNLKNYKDFSNIEEIVTNELFTETFDQKFLKCKNITDFINLQQQFKNYK